MTPTKLEVTEAEYNSGSSARCHCGAVNYFLTDLVHVSYMWNCAKCGEDNFHPCHQQARDKIYGLKEQIGKLEKAIQLALVVRDDEPKHNHQFTK